MLETLREFRDRIRSFVGAIREWSMKDNWRTWLTHTGVWLFNVVVGFFAGAILGIALTVFLPGWATLVAPMVGATLGWERARRFYFDREWDQLQVAWRAQNTERIVDSINDFLIPFVVNTVILIALFALALNSAP